MKTEDDLPEHIYSDVEVAETFLTEFAQQMQKGQVPDLNTNTLMWCVQTMWVLAEARSPGLPWPSLGKLIENPKGVSFAAIAKEIPPFIEAMNRHIDAPRPAAPQGIEDQSGDDAEPIF